MSTDSVSGAQEVYIRGIERKPTPSTLTPFPGFSTTSAEAARKVLNDNHKRFHIFFNEQGFHNHLSHHVLASLALGLPPSGFEKIYEKEKHDMLDESFEYNRKAKIIDGAPSGEKPAGWGKHGGVVQRVTELNWTAHLNSNAYYWSYLAFFEEQIEKHGVPATIEKFAFSDEANRRNVDMLARLIGGVVHPLIHVGYGVEFGLEALVAEGLAMAVLTENHWRKILPSDISTLGQLSQTTNSGKTVSASEPRAGLSLLSIADLIGQDPALAPNAAVKATDEVKTRSALSNASPILMRRGYFDLWKVTAEDVQDPSPSHGTRGWMDKWEELVWFAVLGLGATSRPGQPYNHDFFLMHVNNSTLFLPALLPHLSAQNRAKLLHAHMRTALLFWISRGRPAFHIRSTLNASTETPHNPSSRVDHGAHAMIGPNDRENAWFDLLGAASVHSDEHLTKAVRTLAFFHQHFACREKGAVSLQVDQIKAEMGRRGLEEEGYKSIFEGIEELDGTAFVRTAGQLFETQGWAPESVDGRWHRNGPGFPESWE